MPAIEVFLYKQEDGVETLINKDLVEKGFAKSCLTLGVGDVMEGHMSKYL